MEKGISLEEIAHITKIKITSLQALEDDDYQSLPSEVYTKSFIKIYASYLGLDGNEFVREYLESLPAQKGRPKKIFAIQQPVTVQRRNTSPKSRRFPAWLVLFIVAAVVGGGIFGFVYLKNNAGREGVFSFLKGGGQPASDSAGNAAANRQPAGDGAASSEGYIALAGVPATAEKVLRIEASSSVWLSVKTADKTLFEGLVGAGAREFWPFTDNLSVKISEPDNVAVFLGDTRVVIPVKGVTTLVADARGIRLDSGQ